MHVTVLACFLIRSTDFIYRCIIFLNRTSAIKKYYAPAHAQMQKKKRKVGGFFAFSWARVHKTTYALVNITATCIIFSGRQIKNSGG